MTLQTLLFHACVALTWDKNLADIVISRLLGNRELTEYITDAANSRSLGHLEILIVSVVGRWTDDLKVKPMFDVRLQMD